MGHLEQRLKTIMCERFGSVKEFALAAEIPYTTVDSILKRGVGKANVVNIIKICTTLEIDTDALASGIIKERPAQIQVAITMNEHDHIKKYRALDEHGKDIVETVLLKEYERCSSTSTEEEKISVVPLHLSEQSAAAGSGTYLGPEAFRIIYVRKDSLAAQAAFAVPVSGDSMEPQFQDGDILLVDKTPAGVGEVGVFTLQGNGYVKQLGAGELLSLNPLYKPIPMDDSIICNGKVIGKLNPEWIIKQ